MNKPMINGKYCAEANMVLNAIGAKTTYLATEWVAKAKNVDDQNLRGHGEIEEEALLELVCKVLVGYLQGDNINCGDAIQMIGAQVALTK